MREKRPLVATLTGNRTRNAVRLQPTEPQRLGQGSAAAPKHRCEAPDLEPRGFCEDCHLGAETRRPCSRVAEAGALQGSTRGAAPGLDAHAGPLSCWSLCRTLGSFLKGPLGAWTAPCRSPLLGHPRAPSLTRRLVLGDAATRTQRFRHVPGSGAECRAVGLSRWRASRSIPRLFPRTESVEGGPWAA